MLPTYATWKLEYSNENQHEIKGKKYTIGIKEEFIKSVEIYLDDDFIFWKYSWGDIKELHNLRQNIHPKWNLLWNIAQKDKRF